LISLARVNVNYHTSINHRLTCRPSPTTTSFLKYLFAHHCQRQQTSPSIRPSRRPLYRSFYSSSSTTSPLKMSLESFVEILGNLFGRSGGRMASEPHQEGKDSVDHDQPFYMEPPSPGESKLTIVQITDVYTLDNFASLKTMLQEIRARQGPQGQVISMLTGDFLSPYLLSSIDRGTGMMEALKGTPIDILTWGNHEADIPHATTCKHIKNWPGIWINSNMQSHDMMKYQVPYHIVEVPNPDGTGVKKIGFVAVLSNDPKLYAHFKSPGAFGGAKIEDPWETLRFYDKMLREEHGCDLVVPLEHLYVPENKKTCEEFDFPIILSGHDHHRVDETINGTRLIKPGMDGVHAAVIEISYPTPEATEPKIRSAFVETAKFKPCPELKKQTDAAYQVLAPLRNTELAMIPPQYFPLTSKEARAECCTMGKLVCDMLRASLEQTREPGEATVDSVILMGGNIRGGENYPEGAFFSLEMLEAEIKSDEVIGVVPIPGSVLAAGIEATHLIPTPIPGKMQFDEGIVMDPETKKVLKAAGKDLDPNRIYNVATKISDLTNGQSPPLKEYFLAHPELLPSKGDYINIQTELMGFFARNLFRKLWKATGKHMSNDDLLDLEEEGASRAESIEMESKLRLSVLDRNGDGILSVEDIHIGLRDYLGLSVFEEEKCLAKLVHKYADVTDSGEVTVEDFEVFCTGGLPKEFRPMKRTTSLNKAFPEPVDVPSPTVSLTDGGVSNGSSDSKLGLDIGLTVEEVTDSSRSGLTGQ